MRSSRATPGAGDPSPGGPFTVGVDAGPGLDLDDLELQFSPGVRRIVEPAAAGGPSPHEPAFEPEPAWLLADDAQRAALALAGKRWLGSRIVVMRVPWPAALPPTDASLASWLDEAGAYVRWCRERCLTSLAVDPPASATVSVDPATGRRVGLHFDAWTDEDRPGAAADVWRLDVNFGPGDRHFVFVPFSIADVRVRLDPHGASGARRVGKAFLQRYPGVPVCRVRLAPGIAYLAPVERVLHDGSSLAATVPTWHLAIEGDIGLPP